MAKSRPPADLTRVPGLRFDCRALKTKSLHRVFMQPNCWLAKTNGMSRPRVLIIEDEKALTEVLTYNLEREGYDAVVANDGADGLRKAQTLLPDMILLDLMLPEVSGLEVCRSLR